MGFRVVFSPTSIRDLADSVAYIARLDAEAARKIGDSLIDEALEHLVRHPFSGPLCPEYAGGEIRYWLHRNYRIVYEVNEGDQVIAVLRFWHCSRGDWPVEIDN